MEKSNTYCAMPHIGLALQNDGDFCSCNLNTLSFKDNERKVMFVHKDKLSQAWNSHTRKILQKKLDSGERIIECTHCWDLEDSGQLSPRQGFNELFKHIKPDPSQPKVFVLKPGNTCNLSCRMCNPATSSSWYKDAHKMSKEREGFIGTLKDYTKGFEHIRDSFNRNNPFWDEFVEWLPKIEFLDIYGGEPFLIDGLFDSIQRARSSGLDNVSIQFHTNAQRINEKYLDLLKYFKKASIGISIDSHIPKQLEYIRNGCDAETVFKNTERIIEFAKQNNNIKLHIQFTITTLNVFYINEVLEELKKFGIPINLNFVTGPDKEYDIRHIPLPLKEVIKEKLGDNVDAINFLMQTIPGCDIVWPKFWKTTKLLDDIRGQSFEDTFPEYYQCLKEYL